MFSRERRAKGSRCVGLQPGTSCLSRPPAAALPAGCRRAAGGLPAGCQRIENDAFPKENEAFGAWAGPGPGNFDISETNSSILFMFSTFLRQLRQFLRSFRNFCDKFTNFLDVFDMFATHSFIFRQIYKFLISFRNFCDKSTYCSTN